MNEEDDISKMLNIAQSDNKRVVRDLGLNSSNTNQFNVSLTEEQIHVIAEAEKGKRGIYPVITDIPIEDLEKTDFNTWQVIPNSPAWNLIKYLSNRGFHCVTIQRKLPDSIIDSQRTAKNHDVVIINQ